MTHRMSIDLSDEEYEALKRLASREVRPVKRQAQYLIKRSLVELCMGGNVKPLKEL